MVEEVRFLLRGKRVFLRYREAGKPNWQEKPLAVRAGKRLLERGLETNGVILVDRLDAPVEAIEFWDRVEKAAAQYDMLPNWAKGGSYGLNND